MTPELNSTRKYDLSDRKDCIITRTAFDVHGWNENAQPLNALRAFRDEVMAKTAEGQKLVENYYRFSAAIVADIEQRHNKKEIYASFCHNVIEKCLSHIENGQHHEAIETFAYGFETLRKAHTSSQAAA